MAGKHPRRRRRKKKPSDVLGLSRASAPRGEPTAVSPLGTLDATHIVKRFAQLRAKQRVANG